MVTQDPEESFESALNQRHSAGKVERFNRYLQCSFYHLLRTQLARSGLSLELQTANVEVGKWLRDIAHTRIHGTTDQIPADVLVEEQPHLQTLRVADGHDWSFSVELLTHAPHTFCQNRSNRLDG